MKYISGNDALALACKTFNIKRATAYPGTPSTSILENIHRISDIKCSWSINEKVALEDAAGVSYTGARSVCIMKSVGLNVASDPFMTLSYTGVFGALVIIVCDDPGAYSSQNEQDNRNYAKFAKIPMLEPSTPKECFTFFKQAIEISENFDTPVLFRMTTRVCSNKTMVDINETSTTIPNKPIYFKKEHEKLIMTPKQAKIRHAFIEKRILNLQSYFNDSQLNEYHPKKNKKQLLITSGISYLYVSELFPEISILKIGTTYPLPQTYIKNIAQNYEEIICIEELDPFLEENLIIMGLHHVRKKHIDFYTQDYTPTRVKNLILHNKDTIKKYNNKPPTPPNLCSGCPHLSILVIIRELDLYVCGDIGCYTIGSNNPFYAMHSVLDMGASIPMSTGMKKVLPQNEAKRIAAIIGDSTFFHSGLTGIIDAVQNKSDALIFILDNSATAMTGRQGHPGVGHNLLNNDSPKVDYTKLLESIGVNNITTIDPYNLKECRENILEATKHDEMHVFILKRECALLVKKDVGEKKTITDNCVNCRDCLRLGCPAIYYDPKKRKPQIDLDECIGCEICVAACEFDSIVPISEVRKKQEERRLKNNEHH